MCAELIIKMRDIIFKFAKKTKKRLTTIKCIHFVQSIVCHKTIMILFRTLEIFYL